MLADCFTARTVRSTPVYKVAVSEGQPDAEWTVHHLHWIHLNRLDPNVSHTSDERRCTQHSTLGYTRYIQVHYKA